MANLVLQSFAFIYPIHPRPILPSQKCDTSPTPQAQAARQALRPLADPAETAADPAPRIADPIRYLRTLETQPHLPFRDRLHNIDDPKSAAPDRAEQGHGGHAPQDKGEVEVVADVLAVVCLADGHGENRVSHHPYGHHVRTHGAIVVFLLLRLGQWLGWRL